jgi:phenylacetaldehyde dehydrogenase
MLDPRADPNVLAWLAKPSRAMWCDGGPFESQTSARIDVRDPATTTLVATVPEGSADDVDRVVASASTAFASGAWRALPPAVRERTLLRLADLVEAHAPFLQHLIVVENGKLLSAARREVDGTVRFIRYVAGWATKIDGRTLDVNFEQPGMRFDAWTRREPVGVVAGILPWNMPLSMAAWKAVPALACGCAIVLKPAEETPLSGLRFAELASEAGVPPGWLNVVTGGAAAGAALVSHDGVAKVSFTGSTEVGRDVARAASGRLARVSVELGGKSPAVVFDDADPRTVAPQIAQGIFYNQGQVCAAGSRLYAHRKIYDQLVERVVDEARHMRIGSGFDPDARLGPLVSAAQRDRVLGYVTDGRTSGARLLTGGRAPEREGYFVEPTIFVDAPESLPLVQEEIFGPVLVAQPFDHEDEVIAAINGTPYGLSASLYTENLSRVHRMIPRIRAGTVFVNSPARTDPNLPMGGVKASGFGRDHGAALIDLYTELKSIVVGYQT